MMKKKEVIWYDWNSPSGFELMEMENVSTHVSYNNVKIANAIEVEKLKVVDCKCNCVPRLSVVR